MAADRWREHAAPRGRPGAELVEMTRRLLDRLQWHGVAMVEWRRAADGAPT
jgi:hypothetical protein